MNWNYICVLVDLFNRKIIGSTITEFILRSVIKDFITKSRLINDVEEKQWEHLKDYRDYCAHPVVEENYELISPTGDQVRMHIRNMFETLFLKDAILTDVKIFEEFLEKAESYYDIKFQKYMRIYLKKIKMKYM